MAVAAAGAVAPEQTAVQGQGAGELERVSSTPGGEREIPVAAWHLLSQPLW